MKHTFISKNSEATKNFGRTLAKFLRVGDVVLLEGDLGAGKTTLTKGIAEGLGISEKVNSPTFNIMKLYLKGIYPFVHIDAYRLEDNTDDIGLDEFIGTDTICVIEWPRYISELLPKEALKITITHESLDTRLIVLEGTAKDENIISKLREVFPWLPCF